MNVAVVMMEAFIQVLAGGLLWALSRRERDRALKYWGIGFLFDAAVALLTGHQLSGSENLALSALEGVRSMVGAVCLIMGALRFLGRPMSRFFIGLAIAAVVASVAAGLLRLPFEARAFPAIVVLSGAMIFTGVSVGQAHWRSWGGRLTCLALTLLGVHALDYPLLVKEPEWLAWGHALAAVLEVMAFTGFILLTLERAAARISAQEARYHALFDNAAVGIFVVNPAGVLVAVNSTLAALMGSGQPLEGQPLSALFVHPQEASSLLSGTAESLASHAVRWKAVDGRELSVQIYARRLGQGDLEGVVVDVTQLEHLRRHLDQVQRAELLGQLAAGIAHDINNVLGVVLASGELLRRAGADPERREELVSGILAAGNQGAELTRQLLGFSKHRPGQKTPFELGERVAQVAGMLRPSLGSGIDLVLDAPAQGCGIEADPTLIEQLVVNLVLNARDAIAENGRIAISVSAEQGAGAARVKLEVADNGVGMSPDTLKKAFEPFFSTKSQGTGLGLAVVKRAVTQSSGELNVTSEPGRGTVFQVRFPRASLAA